MERSFNDLGLNLPDEAVICSFEDRMQKVADEPHLLLPTEETWGFYGYADRPVHAGGGVGGFLWFDTRGEMFDFIRLDLPWWNGGPVGNDREGVRMRIEETLKGLNAAPLNEGVRSDLNEALGGHTQIAWWGRFGELLWAGDTFVGEIRSWYHTTVRTGKETDPIPDSEKVRFAKLLQDYGL